MLDSSWQQETEKFHMKHKGETCLIISLGPNLHLTPPTEFDFPSFGINTYYRHVEQYGKPTYYVGVDARLFREGEKEIKEAYSNIPKFIPTPDRDNIEGENFYRFLHRPGSEYFVGGHLPWDADYLTKWGITYHRILGAVFQIAHFMGFTTMLVIGLQHKPGEESEHSWGFDKRGFGGQPQDIWYKEYRHWANVTSETKVLNISEDTYVPEDSLKRDDWKKWRNKLPPITTTTNVVRTRY